MNEDLAFLSEEYREHARHLRITAFDTRRSLDWDFDTTTVSSSARRNIRDWKGPHVLIETNSAVIRLNAAARSERDASPRPLRAYFGTAS